MLLSLQLPWWCTAAPRPCSSPRAPSLGVDPALPSPCTFLPPPSSQETFLFDWADLPLPQFVFRLGCVWGAFLLTLGLPVSVLTFDISKQPVECFVAASAGSLVLVTFVVLRLFLVRHGWGLAH